MSRILFVPGVPPYPGPPGASSERTPEFFRVLSTHHDVVGLTAPWDWLLYDASRAKLPRFLLYFVDKTLLSLRGIRVARRERCELVFCETPHHALVGLVIARLFRIPCVWDSHGSLRRFAESMGVERLKWFLETALERFLARRVDVLITVTERDADDYRHVGVADSKIHVIPTFVARPNGIRARGVEPLDKRAEPPPGRKPILLFFGSFGYLPNREALDYINETLGPELERNGIACEIRLAGRDIPSLKFHRSVRVLGFVPDIRQCIQSADLCIVPLWKGYGILTKLLDIMAAGTAVVASEYAIRLLPGFEAGVHGFGAKSQQDFPEVVAYALAHSELRESFAEAAQRLVQERYDAERIGRQLDDLIREVSSPANTLR